MTDLTYCEDRCVDEWVDECLMDGWKDESFGEWIEGNRKG